MSLLYVIHDSASSSKFIIIIRKSFTFHFDSWNIRGRTTKTRTVGTVAAAIARQYRLALEQI